MEEEKCAFCFGDHISESCEKIKDPGGHKKILIKYARCFSCFKGGHRYHKCRSKVKCTKCSGDHHSAICVSTAVKPIEKHLNSTASAALDYNTASSVGNTSSGGKVALQKALAVVNGDRENRVRVLFDTGSHKTFITSATVCRLGVEPMRKERLGIRAFGSKEVDIACRDMVELTLGGINGGRSVSIEAYIVDDISSIQNIHPDLVKRDYAHLKNILFSDVYRERNLLEVDCLIGSDYLWAFHEGHSIRGGPGEPVAVKTSLGWVLSGPLKGKDSTSVDYCDVDLNLNAMNVSACLDMNDITAKDNRLWDLDSIGIREVDR